MMLYSRVMAKHEINIYIEPDLRGSVKGTWVKNTVDKIKSLEEEKRNLLLEIESLRKQVDARANTLEKEVGALREEVKSLKIIVSGPVLEPPVPNKIQI